MSEHEYEGPWVECWQCFGHGKVGGCFEDTCTGANCDPEDPDFCCWPRKCDVCDGKGGWEIEDSEVAAGGPGHDIW